jgi:hypothetical protein
LARLGRKYLAQIDDISVRDENTWWMLKNCLGRETATVLDPALQFPPRAEEAWKGPMGPFALVYGHNFEPAFAAAIRGWADERGLPLLSVGYRNDWADHQWLTADPFDFALAFARAEAVATNFYHGCVFSLVNEKPFLVAPSQYRSIKVHGLVEQLGAERHVFDASMPVQDVLCREIEPALLARIGELREVSNEYLARALQDDA